MSVVLPVFNAERFVGAAVDSILRQTLGGLEVIAIDDGSTDGTAAILADRASRDGRIRLVSRPNRGLTRTLNEGVALARADYVAIMNADDVAMPERLARQAAFLDEHPRVAAVGSATQVFADGGTTTIVTHPATDPGAVRALAATVSPFAHPTVTFRRQAVVEAGLYRPQLEPAEDYDLWLRLSERHDLANLPEPLLEYRLHAGQATARAFERVAVAMLVAQAAARLRQSGRGDPAAGLAGVDRDVAARLGITDAAIARAAIEAALGRAEMLVAVGCPPAVARLALAVLAGTRVASDDSQLFAAARAWLDARILVAEGRYAAAVPKFIEAAVAEPSFRSRLATAIDRRMKTGM